MRSGRLRTRKVVTLLARKTTVRSKAVRVSPTPRVTPPVYTPSPFSTVTLPPAASVVQPPTNAKVPKGAKMNRGRSAEAHAMVTARKAGTWRGGGLGRRGSTVATNASSKAGEPESPNAPPRPKPARAKKAPKTITVVRKSRFRRVPPKAS
jgi:hypothetical protein